MEIVDPRFVYHRIRLAVLIGHEVPTFDRANIAARPASRHTMPSFGHSVARRGPSRDIGSIEKVGTSWPIRTARRIRL